MGYSQQNGYIPSTVDDLMELVRTNVNFIHGTTYTVDSFLGSGFYKFYYAVIQRLQENEVKTSEIFLKLQDYFRITNERIARPIVTGPGVIEYFETFGYLISVKPPIEADAGKLFIAVDVKDTDPDWDDIKQQIGELIRNTNVLGVVTMGDQVVNLVASNGQSFDYKFKLPVRHETLLRLTITTSENNQNIIANPDDVKSTLLGNIRARYQLGKNFEPQKYFMLSDAPWASEILLEYSIDGGATWSAEVYDSDYDELLETTLANTTVIEG